MKNLNIFYRFGRFRSQNIKKKIKNKIKLGLRYYYLEEESQECTIQVIFNCLNYFFIKFIFSLGIVKCLFEEGLLPRIITGSSAGSIAASLICTTKYEDLPKVNLYQKISEKK